MSRRSLLFILAGALALVLGVGAAVVVVVLRPSLPSGSLETAVTDVTVVAPPPPPATETAPPEPVEPPEADVDKRCWTMFGGSPRRELSRPAIALGIPAAKPMWARGLKAYVEYPPSYCDGVLYVNTFRGDTWAIEAETGKVVWKKVSSAPKPSTPAIAGDKLIVSSKDGTVTALTRQSGKLVWQLRTNAKVESSPAVADDTVFFGATDGRLFAVDVDTGRTRWAYDTGGRINSSPSLADGRVCITTYSGSIFCLRQGTGEKLWSTYVKRDTFRYESFYASASTDGERLYTISRSGRIVTLDADTGRVIWTDRVNSLGYSTPAVGDLVFFSTLETETYAARVSDGKIVWRYGLGKYSPGIATERAYYFTLNGMLVAFRGRDGPK